MKTFKTLVVSLMVPVVFFSLTACNPAPKLTAEELAARTTALSSDVAKRVAEAIATLEEFDALDVFGNGMDVLFGTFAQDDVEESGGPDFAPMRPRDPEGEDGPNPDEIAQEIEDALNTCFLVEANIEEQEPDKVVYLLPGELLCSDQCMDAGAVYCDYGCDPSDQQCIQDQNDCVQQADDNEAECISTVNDLQLRLMVTTSGDGVELTLLVGPDKYPTVALNLQDTSVTLSSDLAELKDAVWFILNTVNDQDIALPEIMEGQVEISLTENGEKDFSIDYKILSALHVKMDVPDVGMVELTTDQAQNAATLEIDGQAKVVHVAIDLNAATASVPFASLFDDEPQNATGNLIVELAGLEGGFQVGADDQEFTITGLGLGDSTSRIRHDDIDLLTLDINPDNARHMDVNVSATGEMPVISLDPGAEIRLYTNLGHIDQFLAQDEEPAPAELRDQTYTLSFFAPSTASSLTPVQGDEQQADAVKVLSGTLSLSSTALEQAFVVQQGQCFAPVEDCEPEVNGVIECMAAFDCP